ncbi:phage tail length tape measure family protein [Alicycliphilus denitrificans]|uniref:phage tail length tape measure family protein n=1 Tax=Alicycliphilus denitrificans TaxID=179636 RepID=UPI0001D9F29C|nr:phage tail length tape measure family protein [Alicycliphilus denitrificans]ADU99834.1 Prophage tail length tape measure [Alicycliphilus denitrificans BC]
MSAQFVVGTKVTADASQYTSELTRAGQTTATYTQQVQAADTAAQAMGSAIAAGNKAHAAGAISAAQHAAAMRMLPAQITDVVTSLSSGMPVWMVAIQQGGQIKDSFGGAGNAMRAMLGAITPTIAGLGLLAGAAGLATAAYYQGSREADGYRQAIVMTGNAADTTVNQLTDMARAMSAISGTQGAAAESLTALAGTGAIASENLQQFATVAMDLERRVGQPIKTTAQHLEELGKAPVQASLKLNEQYHYLTEAVYSQIKALQDQGKQEEAASLAQRTYANAMAERTAELRSNLGTLERLWEGLGNTARRAWDAMLNVGRAATLSDVRAKIEETNSQLNDLLMGNGFDSTGGGAATGAGGRGRAAQIERLKKQLSDLYGQAAPLEAEEAQAQIRAEKQATDAIELAARQRIDTLKKNVRPQAEIRKQEIDQLDRDRETLKLSTEEYNALLAGINEKYKDKKTAGAGGIKVSDSELANLQGQLEAARLYGQQLATLGAGASELNAGERESLKIGEELARVTDAKTAARLREKQAIAEALGVQLRSNDGLEKSLKAHQSLIDTTFKDADAITQRATAQEAANSVFGKGRTAIEQMTLAELEHQMAEAQASDSFDPKYIAGLELKIAAQKRYVAALQGADYKAAEQHVNELLRGARELAKAYEDEQQLSGLTALEREKIVAQRQVELKYAKELAAIDKSAYTDAEKQALREQTLEAQRIESAAAVAKAQQQYMARASDEINRSLTDALMRGFESGKSAAENLADTTVNLFKSMVLRPTISAIMTPVSLVINGIVQQGLNAVGLGSGGGGLLNMASNASSLYSLATGNSMVGNAVSTVGGWLGLGASTTGLGLTAGAGAGAIGAGIGSSLGLGAAGSAAGTGLGLTAGGGLGLTAGSAGASAIGAGIGTGAAAGGAGISSALAAIPGWGWAAAAVLAIAKFAGAFEGPTPHSGGAGSYSAAGGASTGRDVLGQGLTFGVGERYYSGEAEKAAVGISQGIVQMLDSTAEAFGNKAGYYVATAFADDSSKDGAWGSLIVRRDGEKVLDWADTQTSKWAPKVFADGEEGQKQYAAAIANSARDALKTALGDSAWAKDMLDALGDGVTLEGLGSAVAQITAAKAALDSFGQYMPTFSSLAGGAVSALVQAAGGMDPLKASMATFVDQFYSESEKLAVNTGNVRQAIADLGFEMPGTREEFKVLVQAQLALGEAGAETAAGLLGLSGAFASVTRDSATLADSLSITADSISSLLSNAVNGAGSEAEAQQAASAAFEQQLIDGMLNAMSASVGQLVMDSLVAPLMSNLVAGATASATTLALGGSVAATDLATGGAVAAAANASGGSAAAGAMAAGGSAAGQAMAAGGSVAGATVANVVAQAQASINAMVTILKDPGIQAAFGEISSAIGSVSGSLYNASGSVGGFASSIGKVSGAINGGGGGGSGGGADKGINDLADSLKNLGNTAAEEVKRLRGLMVEDSPQSQEVLLARFATSTAAARAGDQEALKLLPELSRAIESAAAASAISSVEVARMRGWLAGSLSQTLGTLGLDVPQFAVGTNYVPRDMLALIHEGEAIVPKAFNPMAFGAGAGADSNELRGLRVSFDRFADVSLESALNGQRLLLRVVRALEHWEVNGMPAARKENWSPA